MTNTQYRLNSTTLRPTWRKASTLKPDQWWSGLQTFISNTCKAFKRHLLMFLFILWWFKNELTATCRPAELHQGATLRTCQIILWVNHHLIILQFSLNFQPFNFSDPQDVFDIQEFHPRPVKNDDQMKTSTFSSLSQFLKRVLYLPDSQKLSVFKSELTVRVSLSVIQPY